MKAKYKYVGNANWKGELVDYLTIGNIYEFDMEFDNVWVTYDKHGNEVFEFFPNPSHGKWEKVE